MNHSMIEHDTLTSMLAIDTIYTLLTLFSQTRYCSFPDKKDPIQFAELATLSLISFLQSGNVSTLQL